MKKSTVVILSYLALIIALILLIALVSKTEKIELGPWFTVWVYTVLFAGFFAVVALTQETFMGKYTH